jgi:hypothetical protein
MTVLFVGVEGPATATTDDLVNGGREAVARCGYQVGDLTLEQEVCPGNIAAYLEVEEKLWRELELDGGVKLSWGEFTVRSEMP